MTRKFARGLIFFLALVGFGCVIDPRVFEPKWIPADRAHEQVLKVPTKIHLHNGAILIAEEGFTTSGDTVVAKGKLYPFLSDKWTLDVWRTPLDSVAGFEYYDSSISGPRLLGSTLMFGGSVLTFWIAMGSPSLFSWENLFSQPSSYNH